MDTDYNHKRQPSDLISSMERSSLTKRPKSFMELYNTHQSWKKDWNIGSRYRIQKILGNGSYGDVAKAYDTEKDEIEYLFVDIQDTKRVLREIYILRHFDSPYIVSLKDIFASPTFEKDRTLFPFLYSFINRYIVMDFMETDLYKVIASNQYFEIDHVRYILYQILCGLLYMQSAGVIHRDIKPANILLNEDVSVKICDFGLARELPHFTFSTTIPSTANREASNSSLQSRMTLCLDHTHSGTSSPVSTPSLHHSLTRHVVTRYYRAPELLVLDTYHEGVDMWSVGCITAELLQMLKENQVNYKERHPLFPGKYSSFSPRTDSPMQEKIDLEHVMLKEDDQICVICDIMGKPSDTFLQKIPYPQVRNQLEDYTSNRVDWHQMFQCIPSDLCDLLTKMLDYDEMSRITVKQALEHPFFESVRDVNSEIECTVPMDFSKLNDLSSMNLKQMYDFYKDELAYWKQRNSTDS